LKTQSEPLTFGELKIGKKFIGFPIDGDDAGHGGFRGTHNIFIKTREDKSKPQQIPKHNAMTVRDGTPSHMPAGMRVIQVA
jgi:hypothetical protein